jgi:serine/threonine protein kinase/tetratricopeptide (TPR) repeat protein
MTPEHWQRVSDLYHAVLEADSSRRCAILDSADPEVRRDVESLLSSGDLGTSPLERGLWSNAGALLDDAGEVKTQLDEHATLGQYQIKTLLGRGGMGEVYVAHDRRLARDVALKILPAEFRAHPDRLARFHREAHVLASLNHPNIATIYGLDEAAGVNFLVLELVEGETFAHRLKRTGALPVNDALTAMSQVAEALEAAHRKGITHRDIKPANIKVTAEGRVKVLDFGLAKIRRTDAAARAQNRQSDTETGRILGTPRYMSPEQARGLEVDHRTDVWAFGCVLYELLTARPAMHGETASDTIAAILGHEPDYRALPEATPVQVRRLIQQCLVKDPHQRLPGLEAAGRAIQEAQEHPRRQFLTRRRLLLAGTAGAAAAVTAALNVGGFRDRWLTGAPRIRALAVLPLANLSGKPDQEYFSDGLTDSLIHDLARISAFKVISRTSVMRYKDTKKPLREIVDELGVEAVLQGSAVRSGDRIRINVQLIDGRTDAHLWVESYDRAFADVPVLQSEIARAVARQVRAQLTPQEQRRLASARPVNPEAHNAYLQGAFLVHRPNRRENLDTAQRYFEFALEKDPNYALPHAGIARVWLVRQGHGWVSGHEAGSKMVAAAGRALALDSGLAEVHHTLGMVRGFVLWDYPAAETSFRRAIELDPNYPDARVYYARLLNILKRPAEAMPHMERALELDPHNPFFRARYAHLLNAIRSYDEAIVQARRALAVDSDQQQAQNALRDAFIEKGMLKEALEVNLSRRVGSHPPEVRQAVQRVYDQGNYPEAARLWAELVEARWRKGLYPGGLPVFYTMAGQPDKLLEFFEWAVEQRDPNLPEGVRAATRRFPKLEGNPLYQAILRRMKLP